MIKPTPAATLETELASARKLYDQKVADIKRKHKFLGADVKARASMLRQLERTTPEKCATLFNYLSRNERLEITKFLLANAISIKIAVNESSMLSMSSFRMSKSTWSVSVYPLPKAPTRTLIVEGLATEPTDESVVKMLRAHYFPKVQMVHGKAS